QGLDRLPRRKSPPRSTPTRSRSHRRAPAPQLQDEHGFETWTDPSYPRRQIMSPGSRVALVVQRAHLASTRSHPLPPPSPAATSSMNVRSPLAALVVST